MTLPLQVLFLITLVQSDPASASQIRGSIELQNKGRLAWAILPTRPGYSSSILRAEWTMNDAPSVLRSTTFLFLKSRKLPKSLPYVPLQNSIGELAPLNSKERELLELARKTYAPEAEPAESQLHHFFRLLLESRPLRSEDITRAAGKNYRTSDGHPWAVGWYTAAGRTHYVLAPAGDPETECFGRKGSRCGRGWQKPKYSRAALNHDICHRIEGRNWLGVCAGEFRAAILGGSKDLLETLF